MSVPLTTAGPMLVRMRPPGTTVVNPTDIVGPMLRHWLRADDPELVLQADNIEIWPDKLSGYGEKSYGTHNLFGAAFFCFPDIDVSDVQPAWSSNALGAQAAAISAAAPGTRLRWDLLAVPIPATFRPYFWLVFQLTDPTVEGVILDSYSDGLQEPVFRVRVSGGNIITEAYPGGQLETITGPLADRAPHLLEYGYLPTVGNRLVVDGVGYTGAGQDSLAWALDGYQLFNAHDADTPAAVEVAELLVADRIPCADRLLELRGSYFAIRYGIDIRLDGVPASYGVDPYADKDLACLSTSADGDLACAQGITFTPLKSMSGGYVAVVVDGGEVQVSGDKSGPCFFSGDGGATARPLNLIVAGDRLYWNGSIAGFQLTTDSRLSLHYEV